MTEQTQALVPTDRGRSSFMVPHNLQEAVQLANWMSKALVPDHLKGDIGTCLMIIERAQGWGMSPFALAQCTSNIHGVLCYSGTAIAAACASIGAIKGGFKYTFEGDPKKVETLSVKATAIRATDNEQLSLSLAWKDAATKDKQGNFNRHWVRQPEQQLTYAVARVWARRYTPWVILGVYEPDEIANGHTIEGEAIEEEVRPIEEQKTVITIHLDPLVGDRVKNYIEYINSTETLEELLKATRLGANLRGELEPGWPDNKECARHLDAIAKAIEEKKKALTLQKALNIMDGKPKEEAQIEIQPSPKKEAQEGTPMTDDTEPME